MSKKDTKIEAPKNDDLNYKKYRYMEVEESRINEVINYLVKYGRIITKIYQSPNNENCKIIVIKKTDSH